jgi:phage terminase small subunit
MGLRGPAPKPTGIRVLEGNPSKRPLPENEPQYDCGIPAPPKGISRAAKRIWDDLANEMAFSGVLRRVDQRSLWQLAEDEALLEEGYVGLRKMANALKAEAKKQGKNLPAGPIFALLGMTNGRLAMSAIRDLASRVIIERREFGLTPASRSRISASDIAAVDYLEAKLCG